MQHWKIRLWTWVFKVPPAGQPSCLLVPLKTSQNLRHYSLSPPRNNLLQKTEEEHVKACKKISAACASLSSSCCQNCTRRLGSLTGKVKASLMHVFHSLISCCCLNAMERTWVLPCAVVEKPRRLCLVVPVKVVGCYSFLLALCLPSNRQF